jgi:hypothetical protein
MATNRRGFIQGVLAAVTSSTALVKLATPADAAALKAGEAAFVAQRSERPEAFGAPTMLGEVYMQQPDGAFTSIGFLTNLRVIAPVHDATSWEGEVSIRMSGLRRAHGTIEGPWLR